VQFLAKANARLTVLLKQAQAGGTNQFITCGDTDHWHRFLAEAEAEAEAEAASTLDPDSDSGEEARGSL